MYLKKSFAFLFVVITVLTSIHDYNGTESNIKTIREALLSTVTLAESKTGKTDINIKAYRNNRTSNIYEYSRHFYQDVDNHISAVYALLICFGVLLAYVAHLNGTIDRNCLWKNAVF